jgi:hypothetical protein
MRIYKNKETLETTADYGMALEWAKSGMTVSEYHKATEFGGEI